MGNMIVINDVSKYFKKQAAVCHVSVEFPSGQIVGIVGYNGSGKTVLLKMVCGLMLPSSGTIFVNGKQVGKDVDFPESIGIIIETPGFSPYISGYENLMKLAAIKKKIGKQEVFETLERVGLDPKSKKKVGNYSLGMRQRLGIAQAIMEEPEVLILDEPMNGLDRQGVKEMQALFLELKNQGKTLVLASHHKEDIDICDEIYEMEHGVMKNLSSI